MGAQRRADMKHINLLAFQRLFEIGNDSRILEMTCQTLRRALVDIVDEREFATGARDIFRMAEAHQPSACNPVPCFHRLCRGRRAATKNAANGYVNCPPRESIS